MGKSAFARFLQQAGKYKQAGVGMGGSLLKHSLYPATQLANALPTAGTVLDLGCGEGMLTNLLAAALPGSTFYGVDRDAKRIELAGKTASANASFQTGDILDADFSGAHAAIFNDVLHHHPHELQIRLLEKARDFLTDDGVLILKEVDRNDWADVKWTSFWDNRLYPEDTLNFRVPSDWVKTVEDLGFSHLYTFKVRHPWPASRTVMVFSKRPKLAGLPLELPAPLSGLPARVLVTGATGFLGEHFVRELLTHGIDGRPTEITLIARRPQAVPDYLHAHPQIRIATLELTDDYGYRELPYDFEYVFHLAARVDFFAGEAIYHDNLEGTRKLLQHFAGQSLKRFVFASTMGAVDRSRDDDCRVPLDENSPAFPVSHYGRSKLDGEKLTAKSGLPYTIVRLPWCYGPGMSHTHHVRTLFQQLLKGSPVFKLHWPGKVSLIEVRDLSRLISQMACQPNMQNQCVFVTDGAPIAFGDLFGAMRATVGRPRRGIGLPEFVFNLALPLRRFVPFQGKCLLWDGLAVSNRKAMSLGVPATPRHDDFLLPLARYLHQRLHPSRHRSRVLITGAASGIGLALAKQCFAQGYALYLVDRDAAALAHVAAQFEAKQRVLDLSDLAALQQWLDDPASELDDVELVINNAGLGARGNFSEVNLQLQQVLLQVNCQALMAMSHHFMARFLAAKRGTVVNIASSAALQPLPYMSVYAASKAFVLSFSEGLAGELLPHPDLNVEVITILPSGTATNFQKSASVKGADSKGLMSPNDVAGHILRAVGRGSRTVAIGTSCKGMGLVARVLPRAFQVKLWEKLMRELR
jgi:short-subunit dehydrogenase